MTEIMIQVSETLPGPKLTIVEDNGVRRTHFVDEGALFATLLDIYGQRVARGQQVFPAALLGGDLHRHTFWWQPPMRRPVIVEDADRQQTVLDLPLPGLVLGIQVDRLTLVAVQGPGRPQADSPLFRAPLPNVGAGSVCMGSSEKVSRDMLVAPALAWDSLWGSAFTGHGQTEQSRSYPYDVRELLFSLQDAAHFPEDDLVPLGITLEEHIHDHG